MQKKNEDQERQALATQIEGDLPYNRQMYVNDVRFYLQRTAESIIEAGKRLLVIQQREGYGAFVAIVEDEIGIPKTSAYRFMNAALKSEQYPSINFSQFGKSCSKVYTLLEAPEEELQKFEQLGLFAGKDADELAAMSHKELRELVSSLKAENSDADKKAQKKYKAQIDDLAKANEEFRKLIPPGRENPSKAELQLYYAQAKYDDFESALGALCFAQMEVEDGSIAARIDGTIKTMHARLMHFAEKWEAHKRGDVQA